MTLLILSGGLAALIGLWIIVCKLDRWSNIPHFIAVLLMVFGVVVIMGWAAGSEAFSDALLLNAIAALLFGLAIWLAFDRRTPWGKT
jgi:predicted MFS family arabinose efflux permease